jgi:hypothetical protein
VAEDSLRGLECLEACFSELGQRRWVAVPPGDRHDHVTAGNRGGCNVGDALFDSVYSRLYAVGADLVVLVFVTGKPCKPRRLSGPVRRIVQITISLCPGSLGRVACRGAGSRGGHLARFGVPKLMVSFGRLWFAGRAVRLCTSRLIGCSAHSPAVVRYHRGSCWMLLTVGGC